MHRGLFPPFTADTELHRQVLNAVRDTPECSQAIYRHAPTFEGLASDLRHSISIYEAAQSHRDNHFLQQDIEDINTDDNIALFIDRRYSLSHRFQRP